MTLRLGESLLALVFALAFSALGRYINGRPISGIRQLNESFLTGISATALVLFPFTYVSPHHGLLACGILLGITLSVYLVKNCTELAYLLSPNLSRQRWIRMASGLGKLEILALTVTVCAVIQFVIQNLRLSFLWDGYQIWASKAMMLFYKGGLSRDWFLPGAYERVLAYPPMVSLWEALIAMVRGEFVWNSLKVIFPFFFISTLISTYMLCSATMSRSFAFATTALVSLIPGFTTYFSIGGYADMPQACLITGAVSAIVNWQRSTSRFRHSAAWITAGVCMVKSEGTLLMLMLSCCVVCYWGIRTTPSKLRDYWDSVAIVVLALALRVLYVRWLGDVDRTYGPIDRAHLVHAWHLLFAIPIACYPYLINSLEWGYLWPCFFVCSVVILVIGTRREKVLALGTIGAVIVYTSIFYFTNWEFKWHIQLAYPRLLTQITPLSTVVVMMTQRRVYRRFLSPVHREDAVLNLAPGSAHARDQRHTQETLSGPRFT